MKKENENIWGQYNLVINTIKKIQIADLTLFILLLKNEIKIAYSYGDDKSKPLPDRFEENLDWVRWPLDSIISAIQIDPVMPDHPLLLKPEASLNLSEHSESIVYVRFPVSLKISAVSAKDILPLKEIPTIQLSNTWFGSFTEGEKCYSISSGFRTDIETDKSRPFMVICPIKLKNKTKEELPVDKICLHTQYISLFEADSQLWTDTVSITYMGRNEISMVGFSGKKPQDLTEGKLLSKPRAVAKKSIYTRSFSTLKDLTGAGQFLLK